MSQLSLQAASLFAVLTLGLPQCVAQKVDFEYGTGMFAELPHERGELLADEFPVDFPLTTSDATAQKFFLQGLTQLYAGDPSALQSFREVITRDPNCAMGYWGIALLVSDFSLKTEYMWYAFERRDNVKTDTERFLIDTFSEYLGTKFQPEMVVVDAETGKRRARPVAEGKEWLNRRGQLLRSLEERCRRHPDELGLLPLLLIQYPHNDLGAKIFSATPDHPLAHALAQWQSVPDEAFKKAFEVPKWGKGWTGVGASFWRKGETANAELAFQAACRSANKWLSHREAIPFELQGYGRILATLLQTTSDDVLRARMLKTWNRLPHHPGRIKPSQDPDKRWMPHGEVNNSLSATESQKAAIEAIGPLEWTPSTVPEFKLPRGKADGILGSKDFEGPTIVVFYLGFGCIHCVEQLNELRPRYQDFKDAGIEVVAIGVDPVDRVRAAILDSLEVDGPTTPFEILCDTEGEVFKQFHCWNEFTDEPLHGTFLIDGQGRILWRDISEEPFMQTDFLLQESKRLISLWHQQ